MTAMAHQQISFEKVPLPRSILFVPADRPKMVEKAIATNADAICLDLEDGVAPANKPAARAGLAPLLDSVIAAGKTAYVRVNGDSDGDQTADLNALEGRLVPVVTPKFTGLLTTENLTKGGSAIIAMIEDVGSLQRLLSSGSARPDGVAALALGTEDLCADLGVLPNEWLLTHALYDLVKLGQIWGVPVFGMPGSIGNFTDLKVIEEAVTIAAGFGVVGAFCIHPAQIAPLNNGFAPSVAAIQWARAVIGCAATIEKAGVATHPDTGQMLDAPVLKQARHIIQRSQLS